MYDPASAAAMGLMPVEVRPLELHVENLCKAPECGRKKSRNGKDTPPHVLAVCRRDLAGLKTADRSTSVDAIRIESPSEIFGTGKRER
jgi:hypothetical protein